MTESSFETHEAIRTLQRAGFEAVQAQAVVDVVTRAPISTQVVKDLERIKVQVETNMATKTDVAVLQRVVAQLETNMATKADLADLRGELASNIAEVTSNSADLRGEVISSIANLRGDVTSSIENLRASFFRALWLQGGAYAALIIGLAGLVVARS